VGSTVGKSLDVYGAIADDIFSSKGSGRISAPMFIKRVKSNVSKWATVARREALREDIYAGVPTLSGS